MKTVSHRNTFYCIYYSNFLNGGFYVMSQTTKIGTVEAIFLVVTIMINHIILNLPKALLDSCGSATLLNIVFVTAIALCIVYLISRLLKHFPSMDVLDISEFLGGKLLKNIIGILFMIYFLLAASTFLRSFCESVKIIYFPRTPVFLLILLFVIGIILTNRLGMQSIVRANLIFVPAVLFSIIFIFVANMDNFTIQRMFPLFGNGISTTFFSGISNLFAFGGISLLYFIPPNLKDSKEFKKVAITSILLSGIWLLFSIATLLFIFPSIITTDEILPLYLASRFIEFGRFFQRLDAVFLLIWIISIMSYLSTLLALVTNIFRKVSSFKYPYITIYVAAIVIFLVSLIPQNYVQVHFLETTVYKYIVLGLVFVVSLTILILATLKYKKQHKLKGDALIE